MAQLVARLREGEPEALRRKPQNRIRNGEVPSTVRNAIHNDKGKAN